MKETIGWIGVGSMGHRMSRHLVEAGYPVVVADAVSTERAPAGATVAKSNAEVARQADIIILSLPDGNISQAVAKEIAATSPRRVTTVIDTSTIGIKAAQAAAATLAAAGIDFIDAPVSGGTAGADKATLAIMLACPAAQFERFKGLMGLMGKPFHAGEKPGQGQAIKLLNNFLSATALAATSEAIAFGTQQGIEMKTILDIVNASTGRNTATDDKFPPPYHAWPLRCRLHGQAAAQGHPPLPGQRTGGWYHGRNRQRGGRRVGADGRRHAWLRHY